MTADVVSFPHVSIAPLFFENIVRYTGFFDLHFPEYIPDVLSALVRPDGSGLHHSSIKVKNRVFYLFLRFVKVMRDKLLEYRETILMNISVCWFTLDPLSRIFLSFNRLRPSL